MIVVVALQISLSCGKEILELPVHPDRLTSDDIVSVFDSTKKPELVNSTTLIRGEELEDFYKTSSKLKANLNLSYTHQNRFWLPWVFIFWTSNLNHL